MKTILVTGGTGFIGSNLAAALLHEGNSVRILRRQSSNLFNVKNLDVEHRIGDVCDAQSVREAVRGCEVVFHTAAIVSFWKPMRKVQYETNVIGTRNVVEACLAQGVQRLVHTSSIAALGHPPEGSLADETTPFNWGDNGYKISKRLAEAEVMSGIGKGLDAVMVNPAVVIGPGDIHFNGGKIILSVKKGRTPFYVKGGLNIVFVADVVRGEMLAAEKGKKGERYILGGENLTHKQVFEITAAIVDGSSPRVKLPILAVKLGAKLFDVAGMFMRKEPLITSELIEGAGLHNWYSSEKAQKELGYSITPFRKAVEETYHWYKNNGLLI
jgi:dihydroflavonol-4-reductase